MRSALAEVVLALCVAAVVYALSCALVWPEPAPKGFGLEWQQMSTDPAALHGRFPHRILASLLAYLTGMGGERFVVFVRGLHVVMLACVFLYARRLGTARFDAALVALAVAVTAPVQMYKQHWVGYCDPLGFALFLLMAICARHRAVFWSLFLASLTTHELSVFLLPWLWFLRRREDAAWRRDLVWLVAVMVAYGAFYLAVRAVAQPQFAADFFLAHPLFPWGALAMWLMALAHWLLTFGPLVAVLAWHQHTRASGRERWQLWLVVLAVGTILSIAYDYSRHANLLVLPFVLASARFVAAGHRRAYVALVAATVAALSLWPPWQRGVPAPAHELVERLAAFGFPPRDLIRVVTEWLPAVWPILLVIYALLAAVWLSGWALARWWCRAPAT
ncbi:MAG: hypothetical protein JNM25_13735 [Planctomycetes bacterium]|nr:hypothetical protein [Planctomycetota bacterium]